MRVLFVAFVMFTVEGFLACQSADSRDDDAATGAGGRQAGGVGGNAAMAAAGQGGGVGMAGGRGGGAVAAGGLGGGGGAAMPDASSGAPTEGLVGHWSFDEGAGTMVKDSSANGNGGTLVEGTTVESPLMANPTWVAGKKGSGLGFDGVDDWINVPNSDSINTTGTEGTVTVAAWVKFTEYQQPTAASPFNFVLCRQELGTPHEHFGLGLREGRPTAAVHFFFATAANAITVGEWAHLAMTYDGIDLAVYLNGAVESASSIGWPIAADSTPVTIGAAQNIQTMKEFVSGQMDEVYLYSRALTVQEVNAVMQAGM